MTVMYHENVPIEVVKEVRLSPGSNIVSVTHYEEDDIHWIRFDSADPIKADFRRAARLAPKGRYFVANDGSVGVHYKAVRVIADVMRAFRSLGYRLVVPEYAQESLAKALQGKPERIKKLTIPRFTPARSVSQALTILGFPSWTTRNMIESVYDQLVGAYDPKKFTERKEKRWALETQTRIKDALDFLIANLGSEKRPSIPPSPKERELGPGPGHGGKKLFFGI